jgi:ferric-dicitrate binding protein FerR (iron transport regulator)
MVGKETSSRITGRSLIGLVFFLPLCSHAGTFNLGHITQAEGEITFLNYAPPHELVQVKKKQHIQTDGSYLTQDTSFMTVKFFDNSWLRASPKSKFTLEYHPNTKTMFIHLYSGSVKILFSTHLNENKVQKFIVKSADTTFETVDAKFSVVRSNVLDLNSVYVEKGAVIATQNVLNQKKDMEIVHAKEMVSVKDNDSNIESPTEMTEKEMKFLHSSQYLKQNKSDI